MVQNVSYRKTVHLAVSGYIWISNEFPDFCLFPIDDPRNFLDIQFSTFKFTGSDVARGMLLFARGRPLGKDGLDWLKVHLINLHGSLKKATLKERIEFADGKMDEILDSADNPMNVSREFSIHREFQLRIP